VGGAAYRFSGSPLVWKGLIQAALWDAGEASLVSHAAAAQLHRFPGFFENRAEVLVPFHLDHVCTIAAIHESRRFDRVEPVVIEGFPTVAAADTVVHMAPRYRFARLEWLVDELLARKKVLLPSLRKAHERLGFGCRGMQNLRALLKDRSPGEGVPESRLELDFLALATERGLPPFRRQVPLPGRSHESSRVDFLWPDVRVIVELDGRRWHTRKADFERDHKRDLFALSRGYATARITWVMLKQDPDEVCDQLLEARVARAA
jgi:very-short-patch-repair endonuclease